MQAVTRVVMLTAGLALGADGAILAQDPSQQPPLAIRLAVDRVPVDVSVIGDDGRPITGLAAADFTLEVDGRSRRIVSAEYVSSIRDAAPPAAFPSTFSSNTGGGGRLIMLVVDRGNIGPGRGRQVMEAASRFLARLTPADRVGLIAFPGAGPTIDFTSNHAVVQSGLTGLTGLTDTFPTSYRIATAEALAIVQGDRTALNMVVQRECAAAPSVEERDLCLRQVVTDSNGISSNVNERTQAALTTLRLLIDRLSQTTTPKTIVYISEGLVLERPGDGAWLGPAAARGQVTIYALQLDAFGSDASTVRAPVAPERDKALAHEGLGVLAGSTRGSVLRVVANADNAFARLALELSGYYLLSFEPESGDRDGKPHRIKVSVPARAGLEIRSRSQFSIEAPANKTDEAILKETLQSPALASEIGLKLATYTLRDPASDKLRILMAAEIDRSSSPDGRLALAYSLVDEKGRLIHSQIDHDVKTPVSDATQKYTGFILSDSAGTHTLKIAVVDERGRRGSVEHSFRAGLTEVGEVRATDLLIADEKTGAGSAQPVVGREFTSGTVTNYIELYAEAADVLKNTTVMFEVAKDEQARALDGAAGRVQPATANSPNRRTLEGSIPLALLPPGDYVARAVVSTDGRKVGQVTRPFRVGKTATVAAKPKPGIGPRTLATKAADVSLAARTERFERASVLTPQVVSFFVERLNIGGRGEPNPEPVIELARAGRFDDAVRSLSTPGTSVSAAFLSGLALYSKGELEPAAARFREALRLDSEFFPAAFYLGTCYAAGGRDQEAVGAWQLALVTESDAPFIYTLLGDALLRLREVDQALVILNDAAARWPENDEVQVRIGAALAMAGKRADALRKLETYLDKHPDDQERQFVALRLLYQARTDGKPIRSTNEDRALFTKWADAYTAAKGPQLALVVQWQKTMSK